MPPMRAGVPASGEDKPQRSAISWKRLDCIIRTMSAKSRSEAEPANKTYRRRHQCPALGVWARSSPAAVKRGVVDAGLEVGHTPRDHRFAVRSLIDI